MITRIVKMEFETEAVPGFLELFEQVKHKIRASEGCEFLKLYQDLQQPEVFFTYSHWQAEADLQRYRNSELFEAVWAQTKAGFRERAQAWSVNGIHQLD